MHKAGLYQEKESSWFYRVYGIFLHVLFSIETVNHCIYVYRAFETVDIKNFATALSMTLTLYSVSFKSLWFFANLSKIKRVLVDLLNLCNEDHQSGNLKLRRRVVNVTRVVKVYFGSAFIAISVAIGLSVLHSRSRVMPYESSTFLDYKSNVTAYWIMIFYQTVISVYGVVVNYSADLFPVIFMAFAIGLLEDLSDDMETVCLKSEGSHDLEPNGIDFDEKLRECIDHHVKIRKLVEDISNHFSQVVEQ